MEASGISDHRLVYCELSVEVLPSWPIFITFRNFKYFNASDLVNLPWQDIVRTVNIDDKIRIFNTFANNFV